MKKLSPVKLTPAVKDYIWGGDKLKTEFGIKSDSDIAAEAWELSAHHDGESMICGGEFNGLTLSEYIEKNGREILGKNAEKFDYFPVLIKLIDARSNLSVQVHPDDKYALSHEGEYGKTEMWYVLGAEDGAFLYYGFRHDITREEYIDAINGNTLTELLNAVPVHKGDVFFIPSGTVHAIGAGILICEIQQNSNTTYRVYDYGRRDKYGNTRPLHIEKAVEVSSLKKSPPLPEIPDGGDVTLAECEYFTVRRLRVDGETAIKTDMSSFRSVIVTNGSGTLFMNNEALPLEKGGSVFIPAQVGECTLRGRCEIILTYV